MILDSLWTLLSFVVAIGVLVTVHEFGHFYVARLCGVRVLRFSIGFGKALWSRTDRHGTEFVVAPIPLGGYVRMLDGRVDEVSAAERPYCFDAKPVGQRMAILVAGPAANLIFAVLATWLVLASVRDYATPVVGTIASDSIAARAGLPERSQILAIGGREVLNWESAWRQLLMETGESEVELLVRSPSDGGERTLTLDLSTLTIDQAKGDLLALIGLTPYFSEPSMVVANVVPNGPAHDAGLRKGDRLVTIDGKAGLPWSEWVPLIQGSAGKELAVEYERDGALVAVRVVPATRQQGERAIGFLGISPQTTMPVRRVSVMEALSLSVADTWHTSRFIVFTLGQLIMGKLSLENLSGPVAIAQVAGESAAGGWLPFISFLALISINLGIINLVPLPVLDGGHLLFFLIEAIRGKAVPERIQELGFRLGWGILLALMCIALFNDITRL